MTVKQFWIFTCTMALAVFGGLTFRPIPVRAQTIAPGMGLAFLTPVASVSACAWPAGWPTGATMPAIALCGLTTGQIATATNGGTFSVQTGIAGPAGPAGAAGTNGTNGANGAPGAAATITIGTVTTLPAGSNATVTNSGTANAAVLNFGIPAGAAGATGATGPAGTLPATFTCSSLATVSSGGVTLSGCP